MKIKIIETIRTVLAENPVVKMKIIANKENKSSSPQADTMIINTLACFSFFSCLFFIFMTGKIHYIEKTSAFGLCAFTFLSGVFFYLYGKIFSKGSAEISKTFDSKDYSLLCAAGSKEDKEVLELRNYIDMGIKYRDVGV